jgi:hypothetical protein
MRLLVAFAVMTHALWGCCMHHAHGASVAGQVSCAHDGAAACAGSDEHDPDRHGDCGSDPCHAGRANGMLARHAAHEGTPSAPAHAGCSEVKCLWLAGGAASVVEEFGAPSATLECAAPAFCPSGRDGANRVCQATRQAGRTPPVRAHLMKCVLLL